ncbi:Kelch repeat-containing protein [Nocardioides ungokensis]
MTARAAALAGLAALVLASGCSGGSSTAPTAGTTSTGDSSATPGPTTSHTTGVPSPRAGPPRITSRVLGWHLPGALSRGVAMVDGPRIVLAGGLEPGDHSSDQVLSIDPQRGVVGTPGHLAVPLHDSAGAVLAGRPTVIGGGGASELSDVQSADRHGRWHVTGHLPGARSDLAVVPAGGRGLVIGGYDGVATPASILATTDGRSFHRVASLPYGLRYSGVARADGHVWILGGEVDGRELGEVLRFDPRSGQVRRVGRMPRALGHEAVVPVGHRLLVLGGRTAPEETTAQMWWYSLRTGAWTRAGRLPYPVADASWVADGAAAYLLGGETPDFTDRVTRVGWRR